MLCDDHHLVLDGLSALLQNNEAVRLVPRTSNGAEALSFLDHLRIDIVVMDIDMPVMNGIDALRAVKQKFSSTRVLMLTMHAEKSLLKKLIDLGADGFLPKNCDKARLVEALETIARGEKYFAEDLLPEVTPDLTDSASPSNLIRELTEREIEILTYIALGLSNKEIGDKLFISHRTVDTHRTNLMKKLDVHKIAGLIRVAMKSGLIQNG